MRCLRVSNAVGPVAVNGTYQLSDESADVPMWVARSDPTDEPVHCGVFCDGCDAMPIRGVRYRSASRISERALETSKVEAPLDLCEACYQHELANAPEGHDQFSAMKTADDQVLQYTEKFGGGWMVTSKLMMHLLDSCWAIGRCEAVSANQCHQPRLHA